MHSETNPRKPWRQLLRSQCACLVSGARSLPSTKANVCGRGTTHRVRCRRYRSKDVEDRRQGQRRPIVPSSSEATVPRHFTTAYKINNLLPHRRLIRVVNSSRRLRHEPPEDDNNYCSCKPQGASPTITVTVSTVECILEHISTPTSLISTMLQSA